MSERLGRLAAIVRADFLIRLRRPSTAVVFLLLSAIPYWWIPDPSTGRALMEIHGKRALYNSATIGMATALLATMFIGLAGFYVVSNALRRDILSRCGFVIASTTMRGSEYLIGKFAGNVVFLSVFTAGFMVTSMAMVLVRGEAPLEPFLFAKQYLLLVPPSIFFVSAIAVLFECVPWLSGKFGDIVYFIVWMTMMGFAAGANSKPFDVGGFAFMRTQLHTDSLSIGATTFDANKGTYAFPGMEPTFAELAARLAMLLWPVVLLVVARLFFHRFDPARVRVATHKEKRTWLGRFNALSKPLARLLTGAARAVVPASGSFAGSALSDAIMTIAAFPLTAVAMLGVTIASVFVEPRKILPIAFAAAAIAIADIASREKRAGTSALVYAAPYALRTRFVAWKFTSAVIVALLFLVVPIARIALSTPTQLPSFAIGILFLTAAATALGIASATPKTFIVLFLTFWYLVINDNGKTPAFDVAGFYGAATPAVTITYAALGVAMLTAAHVFHAVQLKREW
ncbi:MAG TPA: hypothetical protein VF618_22830 [Thermoanaerobaculia bacterium]